MDELDALRRELSTSQSLLRAVFDGSPDPLLLTNGERKIVDANVAACDLAGLAREQLLGCRLDDLAAPNAGSAGACGAFLEEWAAPGQFSLQRPDGATRVVDYSRIANVAPGLQFWAWRDVTDRTEVERALRRSEARFRAMTEKSKDGISLLGADVRSIYQSPAVDRMLGYSLEEAQQLAWQDFVDEDQRPKLAATLAEVMKGPGASASLDFRIRRRDGTQRWLELTATNWLEDPDIAAIVTNFRDITERETLEEEREGFFALSLDLFCIATTEGRFRKLNSAWETTLGWTLEELYACPWLDLVHPEDREATEREGTRLAEGHTTVRFENRYRCRDGSYRRLQWSCIPASNGLLHACAHDVTEERATGERDRLLFTASPLPMWLADAATLQFLDANDAAVRGYGYTREEFLSIGLRDIVVSEHHPALESSLSTLRQTGIVFVDDRLHRTKRGEVRHVQITKHTLEIGGRAAILAAVLDVTAAKAMERERARHVERLRLLETCVSRLNDIVMITRAEPLSEPGPEVLYVNDAFTQITGYATEEILGRTARMLLGPETDRARLGDMRAALERGEPVRGELVNYTKAGVPYWVDIDIAPVTDEAGVITHFVGVHRDVTEQHRTREALRQSEERLRQAQKMEAIGTLAGGIAHDFNNLLSVILSYTSLMLEDTSPNDPILQDLSEIHQAGLRATALTRQLLAFSRKQLLEPTVIDINTIVLSVRKMLGRVLGEDVELHVVTAPDAGKIFGDAGQIEQVIMNLVVNARDAMPDGGTLTLETSSVVLGEDYCETHPGAAPGPYVMLAVTDTGVGMDRATRERVFDPFFTTKERGKGTGLGLSTVYGIVQQSGGHVWLYSELGQGTTFKIYLPRTDRAEAPLAPELEPVRSLRGTETILLVEDEDPVRRILETILRRNGYHVLEAQNGGEAFLLCEQFTATIHLLITDVVMPRMNGKQLAERLAILRPDMKVLFVSGYTENTIVHHGVLDSGVEFLAKPILPEALLKKIRRLLSAHTVRPPA